MTSDRRADADDDGKRRTSTAAATFHERRQAPSESFDAFYASLVELLDASGGDLQPRHREVLLRDAIVRGLDDPNTRDQLRKLGPEQSLANAVALCRMAELLRARAAPVTATTTAAVNSMDWGTHRLHTVAAAGSTEAHNFASTEAIIQKNRDNDDNMNPKHMCGISGWHPHWLQRFANTKTFMLVYGLLGTTQSMAFVYFLVTLTTIEKRFKIPSYMTGIVISGNECSQILLSVLLSYVGGQRNRPRWIAWGVVFCSMSCFILAMPHFLYGPGEDSLHLTAEYVHQFADSQNVSIANYTAHFKSSNKLCTDQPEQEECVEPISVVPLVLIFISQFVLGIGTTLYYTLGHTYLDDNTKKTNTPMMLAYAMSMRMFGPVVGFLLGFVSLRIYIDPWRTPLINNKDPRWLGAWWFGWILLGVAMLLFSWLIGMFPKELPKLREQRRRTELERAQNMHEAATDDDDEEEKPFRKHGDQLATNKVAAPTASQAVPSMTNFPAALMRLLRNKILMYNNLSSIFYILGSSGTMTYISKYMEVQFNRNSADATIVTGPVTLLGMVSGFLMSGWFISKYRPSPRKLFFWNVVLGVVYMSGQFTNLFLTCDTQTQLVMPDGVGDSMATSTNMWNLTRDCNRGCGCDAVPYSPVCDASTGTTYFSPCHAGCNDWNNTARVYERCSCGGDGGGGDRSPDDSLLSTRLLGVAFDVDALNGTDDDDYDDYKTSFEVDADFGSASNNRSRKELGKMVPDADWVNRIGRDMTPGACMAGCAMGFYLFTAVSCAINWLGATGRIGNILLNFRCVSVEDKSFSQGLSLMLMSLFALIPGPILYGYIIDKSCLLWTIKCGERGNCQLYDARQFRYYLNLTAMSLTGIGVFFDVLVWWYGSVVDLYGEADSIAKKPSLAVENGGKNGAVKQPSSITNGAQHRPQEEKK